MGFMYGMKRAEGCKGWLKRAEGHKITGVGCSAPLFWFSWNTDRKDMNIIFSQNLA
jgi:hypothetical protein